jgi:hypothetical protein
MQPAFPDSRRKPRLGGAGFSRYEAGAGTSRFMSGSSTCRKGSKESSLFSAPHGLQTRTCAPPREGLSNGPRPAPQSRCPVNALLFHFLGRCLSPQIPARASKREDLELDCIAHVDIKTGKRLTHQLGAGDASESLSLYRTAPEGDGWVIAMIYRGNENRSDFAVFSAQDIEAGPIGIAKMPRRVPFGFHGNWRPA